MIITTIKRSYSKTINTRDYGDNRDNWIKLEVEAVAELERKDNEFEVSEHLFKFVKNEVLTQVNKIITSIQPPSLTAKEAANETIKLLSSSSYLPKL